MMHAWQKYTVSYGKLDRSIVWSAVSDDFPKLEAFCRRYAADRGLKL